MYRFQKRILIYIKPLLFILISILEMHLCYGWNTQDTVILQNTTIGGDTMTINGNIVIPEDVEVKVRPGTVFLFSGFYGIRVQGSFLAQGTVTDTILFTVMDTTGFYNIDSEAGAWQGISFTNSNLGSKSTLQYCKLQFSKAKSFTFEGQGGALRVNNYANLNISHSIFVNNAARLGGAISCNNSSPTIINSIMQKNNARRGGAIYAINSNIMLNNCIISNNKALEGGGISFDNCESPSIINNTIAYNTASEFGGAIFCKPSANPRIVNSIIFFNTCDKIPGNQVYLSNDSYPEFNYCSVQNGRTGVFPLLINNPDIEGDIIDELKFENILVQDPYFQNTILNKPFSLSDSSLCIDAGLNEPVTWINDVSGNYRIWNGNQDTIDAVDIGAYEYDAPPAMSIDIEIQDVFNKNPYDGKITVYISGGKGPYTIRLTGYFNLLNKTNVTTKTEVFTNLRPGSYTLEVKDINGYTITSKVELLYKGTIPHAIYGKVFTPEGILANGIVMAFFKNNNKWEAYEITFVRNGNFAFEGIDKGQYMLYAIPNPKTSPNLLPAFYVDFIEWEKARIIDVEGKSYDVDIQLSFTHPVEEGGGSITGQVFYQDTASFEVAYYQNNWFSPQTNTANPVLENGLKPARNVPVLLFKDEKIIGWALSDKSGYFSFDLLPQGQYTVKAQKPGLSPVENPVLDIFDKNISLFDSVHIVIRTNDIITNIYFPEVDDFSEFVIYPNPIQDNLIIDCRNIFALVFTLEVYSVTGNLIYTRQIAKPFGVTTFVEDLSHLGMGLYNLVLRGNNDLKAFKIIIE